MIQLKVDADKLPRADDLKKLLYPSVLFINLSDQEIRVTSRSAFPNLALPVGLAPFLASTPAARQLREALAPAQAPAADQAAASSAADAGATAAPPAGRTGTPPAAPPGRGRRGAARRDEGD
jgi:hypothetical protein